MTIDNDKAMAVLLSSKSLESAKFDRKQAIAFRDRAREEGAAMERERMAGEKAGALCPKGCTSPESGGSGCAAVTGDCAMAVDHPDDAAVDRFAAAMKAKMAASRSKGRSGWDDEADCSMARLAGMLVDHVAKGDPVDIANFCMMLHQRERASVEHHPCYGGDAALYIRQAHIDARPTADTEKAAALCTDESTLPCPFCGSNNISDGEISATDQAGETVVQSVCMDCGACGPGAALDIGMVDYGDVKAIAAWNRRTAADAGGLSDDAPGSHHLTPENIAALIDDMKACAAGEEVPPIMSRDWRGRCGVIALVLEHLAADRNPAVMAAVQDDERGDEWIVSRDDAFDEVMQERDSAIDMADDLAAKIGEMTGKEIGEHSNLNCPWANAIEFADEWAARRAAMGAGDQKPIAWLRFWAGQYYTGQGDIECDEGYEVCKEGDKGVDGSPAFPVFDRQPASGAAVLEPVDGDLLPPVGSKVLIHLWRQDEWVEHTVSGYYVWCAQPHQVRSGEKDAHRVFVRVKDAKGYDNARLLSGVRPAATGENGGAA